MDTQNMHLFLVADVLPLKMMIAKHKHALIHFSQSVHLNSPSL